MHGENLINSTSSISTKTELNWTVLTQSSFELPLAARSHGMKKLRECECGVCECAVVLEHDKFCVWLIYCSLTVEQNPPLFTYAKFAIFAYAVRCAWMETWKGCLLQTKWTKRNYILCISCVHFLRIIIYARPDYSISRPFCLSLPCVLCGHVCMFAWINQQF